MPHNTGWEVDFRICPKHGDSLHVTYVLDEAGNRMETFAGDTRNPESVGKVVYECVNCQCANPETLARWAAESEKP